MNTPQPALERVGIAFAVLLTGFVGAVFLPSLGVALRVPLSRVVVSTAENVALVGLAMPVAMAAGIGGAIFVSELCQQKLQTFLTIAIECLVVVPGIAYAYGSRVLPASLREIAVIGPHAGTFMVVSGLAAPTIALLTIHILKSVPTRLRDAAVALGATKVDILVSVVLPLTRSAIGGACLFGFVRALGETIALTSWGAFQDMSLQALFDKGDAESDDYRTAMRLGTLMMTGVLSLFAYRLVRRRVAVEEP